MVIVDGCWIYRFLLVDLLLLSAVAAEVSCDGGPPPLFGDFALVVVPPPTAGWAEDK